MSPQFTFTIIYTVTGLLYADSLFSSGFDGISDKDDFPTHLIEARLANTGIINGGKEAPSSKAKAKTTTILQKKGGLRATKQDSDSEDDW